MKTDSILFGTIENNDITLYTLKNDNGMTVKISDYGATITSITLAGKDGKTEEITCGFDHLDGYFSEAYRANAPYFGGTVGRYCSRIGNAKFNLNGISYYISKNAGDNNLHGGITGFDKHLWKVDPAQSDASKLTLKRKSKDLEEGFPGNVTIAVCFSCTPDNELRIDYTASTDKDTPFAVTNHTYFNLSGFKDSIEGHQVQIHSNKIQEWNDQGVATGKNIVVTGAEDLRVPKAIKEAHEGMGDGFDHYYLFEEKGFDLGHVATISDPSSKRSIEVSTTEPGMLFYTGKYTSNDLKRESGLQYGKFRGFCCETHRYPNGPNIASPKSILKAGEEFNSTTIFKFRW